MLHDSPEKPKNPIKKAIRRRNAKAVSFAPPQYFDYEYDTEEDEDAENGYLTNEEDDKEDQDADEITAAEPTETTSRVIIKPTPIESVKIGISEQGEKTHRLSMQHL